MSSVIYYQLTRIPANLYRFLFSLGIWVSWVKLYINYVIINYVAAQYTYMVFSKII